MTESNLPAHRVILKAIPADKKVNVIKLIHSFQRFSLKEARDRVEALPIEVCLMTVYESAYERAKALRSRARRDQHRTLRSL
jgi:ribosomal protein L7/L12